MKNIIVIIIISMCFIIKLSATDYYISSTLGDDTNNGLSPTSAFQTISTLNAISFSPGDKILFKSGDIFLGMFWIANSGLPNNPIVIDKYGGSANPIIDGNGYQAAILIFNSDYLAINNLNLTNEASHLDSLGMNKTISGYGGAENDFGLGKNVRFGIKIVASTRVLNYFRFSNIIVQDVFPTPTDAQNEHKGYGIKFESQSNQANNEYYNITNVVIDSSYFTKTGHYGLWFKSLGLSGLEINKHTDVTVRNSQFYHTGGSGFVSGKTQDILIENCVFDHTGSSVDSRMWERGSGYWAFDCKNVIVQNNQFLNARGPKDSYGAHIDFGNKNVVFQYNYSFNNEGGFVEILGDNINCGYRYNISINDGWRIDPNGNSWENKGKTFWVSNWCGSGNQGCANTGTFIYNNTVFIPNTMNPEIFVKKNTGDTHIYNNLIYVQSGGVQLQTLLENLNNTFYVSNNLYYKETSYNFDIDLLTNALYGDPLIQLPGSTDSENYKLLTGSPALSSGSLINGSSNPLDYLQNNGGMDFFGNSVSNTDTPNIGAYNGLGEVPLPVINNQLKHAEIYPNPTSGIAQVVGISKGNYRILNLTGQTIKEGILVNGKLDLSELPKSVYILQFESSTQTHALKQGTILVYKQ